MQHAAKNGVPNHTDSICPHTLHDELLAEIALGLAWWPVRAPQHSVLDALLVKDGTLAQLAELIFHACEARSDGRIEGGQRRLQGQRLRQASFSSCSMLRKAHGGQARLHDARHRHCHRWQCRRGVANPVAVAASVLRAVAIPIAVAAQVLEGGDVAPVPVGAQALGGATELVEQSDETCQYAQ